MKNRLILETIIILIFMGIGFLGGHYQGLSLGYSIIIGDMQQRVEMGVRK